MLHTQEEIVAATDARAKEMIRHNLAVSDVWLWRALLALYARQTATEQQVGHTQNLNSVGFNGADSSLMSSFAVQVQKWVKTPPKQRKYECPLSVKQLVRARERLPKYAGQLLEIAREKLSPVAV